MSTSPVPSPTDAMVPASATVNVKDVEPLLVAFALHMAYVHKLLFGKPMVITSGKDSIHSPGSLHAQGRALDIRLKDLAEDEQFVFLSVLLWGAPANKVAVFDERALGEESHVHIEYHG